MEDDRGVQRPSSAAEAVLALALSRPPTAGATRLVCVDGPAGSGKTTLADGLAALEPRASVVHTDDLLDGWDGLPDLPRLLRSLVEPLAQDRATSYRRYDWHAGRYAATVPVAWTPLLVVEGVGSGARLLAPRRTALVWVDAPDEVRLARWRAREGPAAQPHWHRWVHAESGHFAAEGTRAAADLLVDGVTGAVRPADPGRPRR